MNYIAYFIRSYFKLHFIVRLILNGVVSSAISVVFKMLFLQNESDATGKLFICILTIVLWILIQAFLFFAYEYCLYYRPEKDFLKKMKNINDKIGNTNIFKLFKDFIIEFGVNVTEKQFQGIDQQKTPIVDLAFELASFNDKYILEDKDILLIHKNVISSIRRKRVLEICKSLLCGKIKSFYATEFHLIEVIKDEDKWNYDKNYRIELQRNINIKDCLEKKRIIAIKKTDYDRISNKCDSHFEDFISYLEWHLINNWEVHLYIVGDILFPLKLKTLGMNNDDCNDLTDFLYVEYCKNNKSGDFKKCVVFAQNDEGKCKYFEMPTELPFNNPVTDYKSLFISLLNGIKDNVFKRQEHIVVDKVFITTLRKR